MFSKITEGAGKIGILAAALMVMMAMMVAPAAAAEGDLEVTVNDADGNAVEGASVSVSDSSGTEVASGTTDSNGVASFTGVGAAGDSVDISVTADGYQDASQSVTLATGETTTTTMSLTPSGDIELNVSDGDTAVGSASIDLVDASDDTVVQTASTDADGNVTFSGVAHGDYYVSIDNADYTADSDQFSHNADLTSADWDLSDNSLSLSDGGGGGFLGGGNSGLIILVVVAAALILLARD